ncbi:MAG: hypothetical protein ABJB86_00905 [Bacteroidota bacterium]
MEKKLNTSIEKDFLKNHQIKIMGYQSNIHHDIQLSMNEIAPLWYKFRDAEPKQSAYLHIQYCEMIQEAIWMNETNEAFRLLVEGIQRYDAIHEA